MSTTEDDEEALGAVYFAEARGRRWGKHGYAKNAGKSA
jgi:hypothetical protein